MGRGDPMIHMLLLHSQNAVHFGRIIVRVLWMAERAEGGGRVVQLVSVAEVAVSHSGQYPAVTV